MTLLLIVIFYFCDYVCTLLLQTIVVKCDYVPPKNANTFIAVVHLTIHVFLVMNAVKRFYSISLIDYMCFTFEPFTYSEKLKCHHFTWFPKVSSWKWPENLNLKTLKKKLTYLHSTDMAHWQINIYYSGTLLMRTPLGHKILAVITT